MCKRILPGYQSALWDSWEVGLTFAFPHTPDVWRVILISHQNDTHWLPTRHTLNTRLYVPTNLLFSLPLSYHAPVAFNLLPYLLFHPLVSLIYALRQSLSVSPHHLCSPAPSFFHFPMRPCFPPLLVKLFPPSFSSASFISSPTISVPPRPGASLFWYMT